MQKDNEKTAENKIQPKMKKPPKKKINPNSEFKRRYFDYYDDVKISYKEDW